MPRLRTRMALPLVLALSLPLGNQSANAQPGGDDAAAFLDGLAGLLPRDRFDPAAVIGAMNSASPDALHAFVRDQTRLVPYRGMLRGSRGVLMDGLGNSLDRALLLAELLRLTGVEVQLVRGVLPATDALALLELPLGSPALVPLSSLSEHHAAFAALVARAATATGTEIAPAAPDGANRIRQSVDEQLAALTFLLANAAAADVSAVAQEAALLADHWWVRYLAPGGTWIDLDPTRGDALPGATLVAATETWPIDRGGPVELAIPEAEIHRLNISVVVERIAGSQLSESVALSAEIAPAFALGTTISLHIVPAGTPVAEALAAEDPTAILAAHATAATRWTPLLRVGTDSVVGDSFGRNGTAEETEAPGGGGGGGFFGSNILGPALDVLDPSEMTAVFVEYRFLQPGAEDAVVRRSVVDLIGPGARADHVSGRSSLADWHPTEAGVAERAFALTEWIEIVPQVSAHDPSFTAALFVAAYRDLVATREDPDAMAELAPLPGYAHVLAVLRHAWGSHDAALFVDRLNLLTAHYRLAGSADLPALEVGLDIVRNDLGQASWSMLDARLARLEQGIVDTTAEAALLPAGLPFSNTAEAFVSDLRLGASWHTVSSGDEGFAATPAGDLQAVIQRALADGYLAIVPRRLPESGSPAWWRVDPQTGSTIGIGHRGWGADIAEYPTFNRIPWGGGTPASGIPEAAVLFGLIFVCGIAEVAGDFLGMFAPAPGGLASNQALCVKEPS